MSIYSLEFWESIYYTWVNFGYLAPFLLALLESLIPALPFVGIVALNVATYGAIPGFLMSYLGTCCGCILVFLFFRFLGTRFLSKTIERHEKLLHLTQWIKSSSHFAIIVIYAIPFTMSSLVNIAYGISDYPKKEFIAYLFIGKFISTFLFAVFGKTIESAMENPWWLILSVLILVALYYISRYVNKRIGIQKISEGRNHEEDQ